MKRLALTASLLALTSPAYAAGELKVYNWFEYIPTELIQKFEAESGIKVTMDTYDTNESMLAALKAGKLGQYDVSVPGDYMVQILTDEGMLDTFTPDEIPNLANIDAQWKDVPFDPGWTHAIPYLWGSTSFAVNKDVYSGPLDSLSLIFDAPDELKGKINVLETPGELLALASFYMGIPQCTADREQLKALMEMLTKAKADWASFGSDTAKDVLVSGEAAAGMIWNGFAAKAREEGANVEYVYAKEGIVVWMDSMVLLKDAPNRENALKFMNFLLEPENSAALANYTAYTGAVTGNEEFLRAELKTNPETNPPESAIFTFVQPCDAETQKLYDAIWTNLKK